MPKIADYTIAGASGTKYTFGIYPRETSWKDVGAVYILTKRTIKQDGGGSHTHVYVGQTQNMNDRHMNHHKVECFDSYNANCIGVFLESSEEKQLEIEADILASGSWPCNG